MRRQIAWTAAVAAGLLAGCQSGPSRPYNDNPLLMSRQPLVVTPPQPAPYTTAHHDPKVSPTIPVPPAPPAVTVAKEPTPAPRELADAGPLLPAAAALLPAAALEPPAPQPAPATTHQTPVPAKLTVEAPALPVPAEPPSTVRSVAGKYGHGPEYTWLQGELDRNYRGAVDLRYRPASEDDVWGGKARLADDARLADFRPGDVVAVEGEIVRDASGENGPDQYPRFHVREIKLVERAPQK